MNEAFLFLNWLKTTNTTEQLLAQGSGWPEWTREEGFDPEEILNSLRKVSTGKDQSLIFDESISKHEWNASDFVQWIESILVTQPEFKSLEGVAGGTAAQRSPRSLQHSLNHVAAKDKFVLKEIADLALKDDRKNVYIDPIKGGITQSGTNITWQNAADVQGKKGYGYVFWGSSTGRNIQVDVYGNAGNKSWTVNISRNAESKRFQGNSWQFSTVEKQTIVVQKTNSWGETVNQRETTTINGKGSYTDQFFTNLAEKNPNWSSTTLASKTSSQINTSFKELTSKSWSLLTKIQRTVEETKNDIEEIRSLNQKFPKLLQPINSLANQRLDLLPTNGSIRNLLGITKDFIQLVGTEKSKSLKINTRTKVEILVDTALIRQLYSSEKKLHIKATESVTKEKERLEDEVLSLMKNAISKESSAKDKFYGYKTEWTTDLNEYNRDIILHTRAVKKLGYDANSAVTNFGLINDLFKSKAQQLKSLNNVEKDIILVDGSMEIHHQKQELAGDATKARETEIKIEKQAKITKTELKYPVITLDLKRNVQNAKTLLNIFQSNLIVSTNRYGKQYEYKGKYLQASASPLSDGGHFVYYTLGSKSGNFQVMGAPGSKFIYTDNQRTISLNRQQYINHQDQELLNQAIAVYKNISLLVLYRQEWKSLGRESRELILNNSSVKKFRRQLRHHKAVLDKYETLYNNKKGFVVKKIEILSKIDIKKLSEKKLTGIFILNIDAKHAINKDKRLDKDISTAKSLDERLNSSVDGIKSVQDAYQQDETLARNNNAQTFKGKNIYVAKDTQGYIDLFGRERFGSSSDGHHYIFPYSYNHDYLLNSTKRSQNNPYAKSNYEKKRINTVAKTEDLFAQIEFDAINAASETYKEAKQQGLPAEACIDLATSTYLKTVAREDETYLEKAYTRGNWIYQAEKSMPMGEGYNRISRQEKELKLNESYILSMGADFLQRQLLVAKDVVRDAKSNNPAIALLRIKLLMDRITYEYNASQRWKSWYAKHPIQKDQKHFFKHLGADLWDTITMPERAIHSEIKGWKSGAGFWGGLKDGMDTEGGILHKDIKGVNHLIKPIQKLFLDCTDWIPWVGKVEKDFYAGFDILGKAVENMPFMIVKNVTSLGKQVWRVVTLQATWKGIWDGIGRDTHSIRHLLHMVVWLWYESATYHYKKIYDTIGRKAKSADRAAKLYVGREEIKKAIVIKHDELLARRKIHHHFHHLVKSPMRILMGDTVRNLKNDKAFSGFRESFLASKYGKAYLKASALNPSLITNIKFEASERLKKLRNHVQDDMENIKQDLLAQAKGLTLQQKLAYYTDYENKEIPWGKIIDYDLKNTTTGKKISTLPEKLLSEVGMNIKKFDNIDKYVHNVIHHSLASFQLYLQNRQANMSKKAQKWAMHGNLLAWAQGVDKSFLQSVKTVQKDLQTSKGKIFKQKAFKDYIIYKDLPTIKQAAKQEKTNLIESTIGKFFARNKSDVKESKNEYKSAKHQYEIETKRITHEWNQWGKKDGKMALTAYDVTFRPHFTINYGPPTTVTSSTLTAKEAKAVNTNITSKDLGKRFFVRAMWTEYLKASISNRSFVSLQNKFSSVSKIYSAVLGRFSTLDQRAKAEKSEIKAKLSTFMSSHILLRDLIMYDSGTKAKKLRRSIRKKEKEINNLIYNIKNMKEIVSRDISMVRERAPKTFKKESDFMQLMNIQVSVFDKSNFKKFEDLNVNSQIYKTHQSTLEAHGITPVKLLCVQSALAYDFEPQVTTTTNSKGKTTTNVSASRYDSFKKNQKKKTELGSDYATDKADEKAGDDLTIGQVLYSGQTTQQQTIANANSKTTQPSGQSTPSSGATGSAGNTTSMKEVSSIRQDWKTFITKRQSKTNRSGAADERADNSSSVNTHSSTFWFKLPHNSSGAADSTTKKTKANLLMLYQQYKMIKHLTHKAEKEEAKVEGSSDGLNFDSLISGETGMESKALDFDSLVAEDAGVTTRSLNRKALRLDDDALEKATRSINREAIKLDDTIDFVDNEVATDEKIAENAIQQDATSIEQDLVNKADRDLVNKAEDIDPSSGNFQPIDEIDEFRNAVIDTASDDLSTMTGEVSKAADSDVEAAEKDISKEVDADEVEAEMALDDAAEAALL